jgi:hypothetical protein
MSGATESITEPQGMVMRWPASAHAPRRAFSDRQGGDFCRKMFRRADA